MIKTTEQNLAQPDVIGNALTARRSRRPQRMAREPAAPTEPVIAEPSPAPQPVPRAPSKIAGVIALLGHKQGATLVELIEATGWLPHTTRRYAHGPAQEGHILGKSERGEVTCYRIGEAGE
jgi:hypothetical protein